MRALRLLVEELLRPHINNINTYEDFSMFLIQVSEKSKTSKHWVDNLIKPTLLIMNMIRAERESDWPLRQWACNEMLPYFLLLDILTMLVWEYIMCCPCADFLII